jgi:hypothetical protein
MLSFHGFDFGNNLAVGDFVANFHKDLTDFNGASKRGMDRCPARYRRLYGLGRWGRIGIRRSAGRCEGLDCNRKFP